MKPHKLVITLAALLLSVGEAWADNTPNYTTEAREIHVKLDSAGHKIKVNFTLYLGDPIISGQHKRVITPMLSSADGKHEALLPSVIVKGRTRAIKDRTDGIDKDETASAFQVLTGDKEANRQIDYKGSVTYEPWMENAELCLREEATGCACAGLNRAEQVVSREALYRPRLILGEPLPCPKEFNPRKEERDAFLIYPVGKTTLYADRYGNQAELRKIDEAIKYVRRNPAYRIQRVYISGYASPEGSWKLNVALAKGRAEALRRYVKQHYRLADSLLVVTPGAENWEGLVKTLQESELPYKGEMLAAIRRVKDPDRREQALREIGGGQPYQTLLTTIYPSLRKNNFSIVYISRERTLAEADSLAKTDPKELNVYEFYTLADSLYADNQQERERLLLTAADAYPHHSLANVNAARLCLAKGMAEKAQTYLDRTDNTPDSWNDRACMLWMQGKPEEATLWWRKAAAEGDQRAKANLAEVAKRYE